MKLPLAKYTIKDLEKLRRQIKLEDISRKRGSVKIALIDDQPFFHLDNLRSNQYEIVHIGNITSPMQVEKYDIIACDLRGVGTEINKKLQGASLIQGIKRLYPDKYIIVYSGSFARSEMVNLALEKSDTNISKGADLENWMEVLDEAITIVIDPILRWKEIRKNLLNTEFDAKEFAKAEHAYVKSVLKYNKSYLEKFINKSEISVELRSILRALLTSAIWAAIV